MEKISRPRRTPFGTNPTVGDAGRATQQRILIAANEAFAELGYARTTVEAITDHAGCSRPTFYQYFEGKEDIHRRLAGRLGAELADLVSRLGAITPDAAGRDVLCRWLEQLAAVYERYRAVANNFSASLRTDDQMVTGAANLSSEYQRALVRALGDAPITHTTVDVLAGAANVTSFGACIYRDRIGDVSVDRLAAALADTLHRTFFGPIDGVNLAPIVGSTLTPSVPAVDEDTGGETVSRQTRGLSTRQRLCDAAAFAFDTLGYDAVRIDDIALEAGVSHGTFYRYFPDKAAIFAELARAATVATDGLLARLPVGAADPRGWASDYYDVYGSHRGVISCLRDARAASVPAAVRARESTVAGLVGALGQRRFGDIDADVVTCFSLLENLPTAAHGYSRLTVGEAVEGTAVLLGRGLFGQAT